MLSSFQDIRLTSSETLFRNKIVMSVFVLNVSFTSITMQCIHKVKLVTSLSGNSFYKIEHLQWEFFYIIS